MTEKKTLATVTREAVAADRDRMRRLARETRRWRAHLATALLPSTPNPQIAVTHATHAVLCLVASRCAEDTWPSHDRAHERAADDADPAAALGALWSDWARAALPFCADAADHIAHRPELKRTLRHIVRRSYTPEVASLLTPDALGVVYVHAQHTTTHAADGKIRLHDKRGGLHMPGIHLARAMAQACMPSVDAASPPVICDPACGTGVFLIAACERLLEAWTATPPRPCEEMIAFVTHHLVGTDLDADALDVARAAMYLTLGAYVSEPLPLEPIGAWNDVFITADALLGGSSLELEAALGSVYPQMSPLDWSARRPDTFDRGGFDVVLSDIPATLDNIGRDIPPAHAHTVRAAYERYIASRFTMTGAPNAAAAFMILALTLTRDEGHIGLLIPDAAAYSHTFKKLRTRITTHATIPDIVAPDTARTLPGAVVHIRKSSPAADAVVRMRRFPAAPVSMTQRDFAAFPEKQFLALADDAAVELLAAMRRRHDGPAIPLGTIFQTGVGMTPRPGFVHTDRGDLRQVKVARADGVTRFAIAPDGYFSFARRNIIGGTSDPAKLGATPKILVKWAHNTCTAALDTTGVYPDHSLFFVMNHTPRGRRRAMSGLPAHVTVEHLPTLTAVTALLNAPIALAWFHALLPPSAPWRHMTKALLDSLPLPLSTKPGGAVARAWDALARMDARTAPEELARTARGLYGMD